MTKVQDDLTRATWAVRALTVLTVLLLAATLAMVVALAAGAATPQTSTVGDVVLIAPACATDPCGVNR